MSRPGDGMRPIDSPHANLTLGPPEGMDDCEPLRVQRTERSFVSWWQPDELDRAALARDGVVRLEVFGDGHPPVCVGVALPARESKDGDAFAALADHLGSLDEAIATIWAVPAWTEADQEQANRELAARGRPSRPDAARRELARLEIAGMESCIREIAETLRVRAELHEASERLVSSLSSRVAELEKELAGRELAKPDRCNWPGCDEPGLCQSGNFGNLVVCAEHFRYTNGTARPAFCDISGGPIDASALDEEPGIWFASAAPQDIPESAK